MEYLLGLQIILLIPILIVAFYNYRYAPKVVKSLPSGSPRLSVLIPARNEESNIAGIVSDVLNSSYANLEVIVLDDGSTDNTAGVVKDIQQTHERGGILTLISGKQLPANWKGKPWACFQLAQGASGDYLAFIDSDVRLADWFIGSIVKYGQVSKADLVSSFPTQRMITLGEKIVVGIMDWILMSFLPLSIANRSSHPSTAVANGQFMLFTKKSYWSLGGHQVVAAEVVEDVFFARAMKAAGLKVHSIIGGKGIYCRMYDGFGSAVSGFSKNLTRITPLPVLILINIMIVLWSVSLVGLFWFPFFSIPLGLLIIQRAIAAKASSQSAIVSVLVTLPQALAILYIELSYLTNNFGKGITWKNRRLK